MYCMVFYYQICNCNHIGWKEEKDTRIIMSEDIAIACYSHIKLINNIYSLE